jgi:hypothetical protein
MRRRKLRISAQGRSISKILSLVLLSSLVQIISSPSAYAADVTLTYDANVTQHQTGVISAGSVPNSSVFAQNTNVTVSANSGNLTRQGFTFGGWNTLPTGLGTNYAAGSGNFTIAANTTLYANWLIPLAARLIGSTGSISTLKNTNNISNYAGCNTGLSGITSDGTRIYFRSSSATNSICIVSLDGTFISRQIVTSAGGAPLLSEIPTDNRDLTFSSGCIWVRATGQTENSALYCISISDWTMRPVATPTGKGLLVGSFWLYGNLIDFPDGRIGAVSAASPNPGLLGTNFGGANGNTAISCPSGMYCKVLRLYTPSRTGAEVILTFSEDIVLADTVADGTNVDGASGWPNDDHGIATDGTYLYQTKYNSGYKVWALRSGVPSYIVFNGSNSGSTSCGAGTAASATGISPSFCAINKPTAESTTATMTNATFFGRNHVTNQYVMGDYGSNKFYISAGVAPPAGPGSDKTITFTTAVAVNLKYGSTTSATYSVNRTLGSESSPNLTGTISYETVTSTACNVNSSTGLVTMLRATGTCQVRVKLASDAFYSDTSSVVVAITPAKADTLTVTASAVNMTYNGNSQTIPYNYSISGLKFSDTVTALSYAYSGTANSGSLTLGTSSITSAGTYTITPSAASISNSDSYTAISYVTGALTVNRATRTITGSAAGTVKYGSKETVTVTTSPSSNLDGALSFSAGSSTACSVVSGTGVISMNRAAGTCSIVPTIAQGANYFAATGGSVAVTPATADALILTADSKTRVFTGSPVVVDPTYSISGLIGSDTVTVTYVYAGVDNAGLGFSLNATTRTNAGTYSIVPSLSMANADSYTAPAIIVNGTLTIDRAARTLSPSSYSKTDLKYGESATVLSNVSSPSSNSDGSFIYTVGSGCEINSSTGAITATSSSGTCSQTTTISRGANYETATAESLTFNLSKADTLTVTTATPAALTYTGSPAVVSPAISVSGLVANESASGATFTFSRTPTCATGGTCQIGDTGPGGGKVFYISGSTINAVSGVSAGGIYLEMAPATFGKDLHKWCLGPTNPNTTLFGAVATAIGTGASNTKIMIDNCSGGAGFEAANLTLGGKSDWFLPSFSELVEIYGQREMLGLGSGQAAAGYVYWSSTEYDYMITASLVPWAGVGGQNKDQATPYLPIRAFSATVSAYSSSTAPTNAGSYVITPSSLTLANSASIDNYVAVTYQTATLTVNKASQLPFTNYTTLSGIFGSNFIVYKFGGSGDGEETFTVTNGTATGCALNGTVLTVTTAGSCVITATKLTSENYLQAESTFTVFIYVFVAAPAAPVSTTPTQIAIAPSNAWSTSATAKPKISGISPSSGPVGTVVTITGTDLNGVDTVRVGLKNLTSIVGISPTSVTGVIPVGASSGPIFVSNSLGGGVLFSGFTVTTGP